MPPVATVSVPPSAFTRAADPRVIAPLHVVLFAPVFRSAPALETPVPLSVIRSATVKLVAPPASTAAPAETAVASAAPPAVAPRALALATARTPSETVVTPV